MKNRTTSYTYSVVDKFEIARIRVIKKAKSGYTLWDANMGRNIRNRMQGEAQLRAEYESVILTSRRVCVTEELKIIIK
jgi:hypothetical protein